MIDVMAVAEFVDDFDDFFARDNPTGPSTTNTNTFLDTFQNRPWLWTLRLLLTLLLATRIITQIRSTFRPADSKAETKPIKRLPYWLPHLGTTPLFSFRSQSWLLSQSLAHQSGVFALHLSGHDYIVTTSPSLLAQLCLPTTPVSTAHYDTVRRRRFFNNRNLRATPATSSTTRISTALHTYTSDPTRITKLTRILEGNAYNLISPAKSWVDQSQWERTSDITVLSDKPLSISASLSTLIRDFSSHILLSTMLGSSFLDANPGFIGDLFAFSGKYGMFMTGLPYWVAPGLGPPALARERCLRCLDGLVDAVGAEVDGTSMAGRGTGMLYDLEDVHGVIWGLVRTGTARGGGKGVKTRTRSVSCEVLEVIWATTFAQANMVVWMLVHLFGDGDSNGVALHGVREELKSVVQVVKPGPTGLPFEDPPRLQFVDDVGGKMREGCPTLRGALLEVQRLEMEAEEYLSVMEDFVLRGDSNSSKKFQLKEGDRIYAAYGATNKDTQYWDRPRRFAPGRFVVKGGQESQEVVQGSHEVMQDKLPKTRSGHEARMQVDVLCIVAALLSFYEIEAVGGGGLKHPGSSIIAGVGVPKDFKAKISRRVLQ
ncbi:hypothetical protein OHC33_008809 [Knufia fluminis]|uniref:Cytochrome P450 n=1 Tax=Knufia fluminis TaxID=191047 RepID=A0AAN8E9X2_9EURO|nr:hypothetical protein OHC33_008809 [Knufia fluminis]